MRTTDGGSSYQWRNARWRVNVAEPSSWERFRVSASFLILSLPRAQRRIQGCRVSSPPATIQSGVLMKHIVQQLKKEREHVHQQLQRIDEALAALGGSSTGASRTISAAGRMKISLAQKARWAKHKATGHAPKPARTISLAGRKRIAAAQRARWAKVKRAA
jgi:hypothetical protein